MTGESTSEENSVFHLENAAPWRRLAFWAGTAGVTVGSLLHLPMFVRAADRGYRLAGQPMDLPMKIGMPLLIASFFVTYFGLTPPEKTTGDERTNLRVKALDDVDMSWDHLVLILVMVAAVTIDVMKPAALAFIMPGFSLEYGLRSPVNPEAAIPASLIALAGITGTVLGSFIWGWMGDRIGRRGAMLMAGLSFMATGVCGSMPAWHMNVFMCFVMGLGAGGMLPIIFTMISETIPKRHRGWVMVLIGGDVAAAYIIVSWISSTWVPVYSWRILWLIGIPTGLLLVLMTRWIPESPRYLILRGYIQEARRVMDRYGATVVEEEASELEVEEAFEDRYGQLFEPPFTGITVTAVLIALGVGLVTFGFQLWIPSNLQALGFSEAQANRILQHSAMIGFPFNFLVAAAYGFWSSKKTILWLVGLTAASMFGFVAAGDAIADNHLLLYGLLIMPVWGISSVTAVLSAYAAEVYPTRIRSRGSGVIAGLTKFGGVAIIALTTVQITPPTIAGTALLGGVPLLLAALAIGWFGIETRGRQLEKITQFQLRGSAADG